MKFYLLWNPKTNRIVIDKTALSGHEVQKETNASCWIDAKRKFGFELTALQQEMLNAKNNSDKASGRAVGHQQDAGAKLRVADGELQDWVKAGFESEFGVQ